MEAATCHREERIQRLLQLPLNFIPSKEFRPHGCEHFLKPMPAAVNPPPLAKPPDGLPPYLRSLYGVPLLTPEQERHQFRKFNYLKYLAHVIRRPMAEGRGDLRKAKTIERLYAQAAQMKRSLMSANLRLVIAQVKDYVRMETTFDELVSDGNLSLSKAVEHFDYTRKFKFSTYAVWAIRSNRALIWHQGNRYRTRFRTVPWEQCGQYDKWHPGDPSEDLLLDYSQNLDEDMVEEDTQSLASQLLGLLDDRERDVVTRYYGIGRDSEELGEIAVNSGYGVSRSRIGQIEQRAIIKLKKFVDKEKIPDPAIGSL